MSQLGALGPWLLAGALGLGCSVGQGEGSVHSDVLFVKGCYRGVFDLDPDFFGANPYGDTLTIRVQRGEQEIQVSDGITLLVNDVGDARSRLNQKLLLGLPEGVSPLGFPLPERPTRPDASLSLYLNNSCRSQNAVLMAYRGTVTFAKLFSGDPNEEKSEARVTDGSLEADLIDPREAVPAEPEDAGPAYAFPAASSSHIDAKFNFVFHRGTPAQPFP